MKQFFNYIFTIALFIAIAAMFYFKPVEPESSALIQSCAKYDLEHESVRMPTEKKKQIVIQCS